MAYLLIDLRRRDIKVRELVRKMEQALIDLLAECGIEASRVAGAPGVYVAGAKIAALGLRIKNGCSFHGLCLNVDMDLSPYRAINPCGYPGLAVTQVKDQVFIMSDATDMELIGSKLARHLEHQLETELENEHG